MKPKNKEQQHRQWVLVVICVVMWLIVPPTLAAWMEKSPNDGANERELSLSQ